MPYTIPSYTVSPGSFYQPKEAGLILDQISGAIAAWSTRRLISTAPADIARGRDASTNEQDFTSAELAGSGFTDLAGAGDGFYVTLYDQIGSNNATQATAGSQPKGVDTGALITDGSVPVLECDGGDALLVTDSPTFDVFDNFTITVRYNDNSGTLGDYIISKWDQSLIKQWALLKNTTFGLQLNASPDGSSTVTFLDSTNKPNPNEWNISTISFSAGVVQFYLNGVKSIAIDKSASITSIYDGSTDLTLCSRLFNGGVNSGLTGQMSDAIMFNRVLSDNEVSQLHTALS